MESTLSLSFEHEERTSDDEGEADGVVPGDALAEIHGGKNAENREGDDFLNGFQLGGGEVAEADAVGRNLKAVFEEGYAPAQEYGAYPRKGMVAQVAIPCVGHEDIGADEQDNGDERYRQVERHAGLGAAMREEGKRKGSKLP